ncbi:hypothetical protein C475_08947 [Halosimplex carlsbadense 2-9-1]|uniref:Uncharacterized protein n=1 Tax=Halosimplex carlsbadense 2-9-1 TaxID=797114 RepID=M0CTL8_9EURY|nr:hypothetical protein [Halosimplex carlsbadense]ELZ26541.1 hypothetical protein C475_08947 [Halosimplex carlsbadense 2-9-1]
MEDALYTVRIVDVKQYGGRNRHALLQADMDAQRARVRALEAVLGRRDVQGVDGVEVSEHVDTWAYEGGERLAWEDVVELLPAGDDEAVDVRERVQQMADGLAAGRDDVEAEAARVAEGAGTVQADVVVRDFRGEAVAEDVLVIWYDYTEREWDAPTEYDLEISRAISGALAGIDVE